MKIAVISEHWEAPDRAKRIAKALSRMTECRVSVVTVKQTRRPSEQA